MSLIENSELGIANYIALPASETIPCPAANWTKEKTLENIVSASDWGYQGYLWNKIFLMSIITENQIRFNEEIAYNEDRLFCFTYAQYISETRLSDEVVYKYILSDSNAMSRLKHMTDKDYRKVLSEFDAFEEMKRINNSYKTSINWQEYHRAFYLRSIIGRKEVKLQELSYIRYGNRD